MDRIGAYSIHVLTALVLLGVIRRTLSLPVMPARLVQSATVLASSTAKVWAVHPLQTESVTYVSQRAESLVSLFCLLTLYCTIRGAAAPRSTAWYVAAAAACTLGMASKEVMAAAPLLTLLYDRTFLAGSFREAFRRRWGLYVGLAATWLLLAALVIGSGGRSGSAGFGLEVGPWQYALTQCGAIPHYLRLSFWPAGLCLDYGDSVVQNLGAVFPQAIAVVALVALTVWALWRRPMAGFLGAFFLAVLAPTSSIVPVATQTVAEHRMYLPLAAAVTAVVIGGYLLGGRLLDGRWFAAWRRPAAARRIGLGVVGAIAVALGCATFTRNRDYRSDVSICEDTVRKCPQNARAQYNLGMCLQGRGKLDEAIARYRLALELTPDLGNARILANACNNLAWILATCPKAALRNGAEAVDLSQQAVRLSGGREPSFLDTLAAAYAEAGRFSEAVATAERAVSLISAGGNTAVVDAARARLQLYQAGSPYHETPQHASRSLRP